MSDSGSEKAASSDEENKNTGQYDDDDEENVPPNDENKSSEDERPAQRAPKSISKKMQRGKRSRFIDDAAEESDDQGGTRENDDEDEDDEDDDEADDDEDVKRPGRKKARSKFIVDDDVEDEDPNEKKEKITITEREKRLDAADYELIAENTGLVIQAPDDDDDEDDEEDDGQPTRRRVRQSGKVLRDDDEEVRKTTKKRFNQILGNTDGSAAQAEAMRDDDFSDSGDSMEGFIEQDIDDDQEQGSRQRRRRRDPLQPSAQKHELAMQVFKEDFSDEEPEQQEDTGVAEQTMYNTFEPNQVIENFLTPEDIKIRETDEPERLQIDLKGRFPVRSVDELRGEADWMLSHHRWKTSELIADTGDAIEEFVHPETKERTEMSKTERSQLLQNRLIDKIVNVLCYIRGVENEAIQHGPITIDEVDSGGPKDLDDSDEIKEAEWEFIGSDNPDHHGYKRRITAKLDIPFILRYRQEYWRDELRPSDVWKIYDLDGKWSAFRTRQESLVSMLQAAGDEYAAAKAAAATGEESLNDVAALYELRHARPDHESAEEGTRRRPIKVTKYQQCEQAQLNELVVSFTMTPAQLAENLEQQEASMPRMHEPPTPEQDPTSSAVEAVPAAEKYGFRDADAVLKGARFMAAKQLATEPGLRDYVRQQFASQAQVVIKITKKGKESAEVYHRSLLQMDQRCHFDVDDDSMVLLVKAKEEGLIEAKVRLGSGAHEALMDKLKPLYLAQDGGDGATTEWNELRSSVLEEALQAHVYPSLEEELLNIRCRYSKDLILAKSGFFEPCTHQSLPIDDCYYSPANA